MCVFGCVCSGVCVCVGGQQRAGMDMSSSFLMVARQLLNCNSGTNSDGARHGRKASSAPAPSPAPCNVTRFSAGSVLGTFRALDRHWRFHYFDFDAMQQVRVQRAKGSKCAWN